jgi:hypothetical protein
MNASIQVVSKNEEKSRSLFLAVLPSSEFLLRMQAYFYVIRNAVSQIIVFKFTPLLL